MAYKYSNNEYVERPVFNKCELIYLRECLNLKFKEYGPDLTYYKLQKKLGAARMRIELKEKATNDHRPH